MVAPVTGMSASPTSRPFVSVMMTFCAITGCTASAKPDATLETRKPRRENGTAGTRLSKSERSFMVVLSSYGAGYGINRSSILRSVVYLEYGGYRTPGSMRAPWYITPRALVNASNPQRPWYFPIPELPTPPNGSSGTMQRRTSSRATGAARDTGFRSHRMSPVLVGEWDLRVVLEPSLALPCEHPDH